MRRRGERALRLNQLRAGLRKPSLALRDIGARHHAGVELRLRVFEQAREIRDGRLTRGHDRVRLTHVRISARDVQQ